MKPGSTVYRCEKCGFLVELGHRDDGRVVPCIDEIKKKAKGKTVSRTRGDEPTNNHRRTR